MDVSQWIAQWGSWTPDKTALRFERSEVGYAELEDRVASVAAWLRGRGVAPGDGVSYLGPNCPELLEVLFACARLGAIFVPLNNRMPAAELRVFLELTQPRLLVAEQGFRDLALASTGESGQPLVETFAVGGELACRVPERVPAGPDIDPGAPALILFTSGTTGRPKGATFTHQNLAFNALNVITALGLTAADEILTAVPMFHTGGLFIHTLPGLCAGATITIQRRFEPRRLLEEVRRERITLLACVPAMTFALAADAAWHDADLSSLRYVCTGSTIVPRSAIEPWQAKGVRIGQGSGSTEACPTAALVPPGSPHEAAFTAGKPAIHTQIRVVDRAGGDLPAGEPGEIWIRGPAVMQGYWRNARATREAFHDGWLRNGDLGLLDDDGYLHVVGRIDETIIVGSSNVHPSDLEAVLDECPAVREAAVVGRPDDELGEVPVAYVVPASGRRPAREDVIGLFKDRLATYKHPRDVFFLERLPRNWHGKIDRARLRELAAPAARSPCAPSAPG